MLAVLVGWLIFLFSAFLLFIGLSNLARHVGLAVYVGSTAFVVEVMVIIVLAALLAVVVARRGLNWASKSKASTVYAMTSVLLVLTILSFPRMFTFVA